MLLVPTQISAVAVQYFGRSGTVFLNSLFDQHPNILTMPAIHNLWLYAYIDQWLRAGKPYTDEEIIQDFTSPTSGFSGWFYPRVDILHVYNLNRLGDQRDLHASIDAAAFKRYFLQCIKQMESMPYRKKFIIAIHLAYAHTIGKPIKERMVILFQSHCQPKSYMQWLLEDFPDTRFIHLVRMPVDSFESYLRFALYRGLDSHILLTTMKVMLNGYNLPNRYVKTFEPGYSYWPYFDHAEARTIRLEDLHLASEATLTSLCEWIGIPWDDRLLESTFNGQKWWNNPESQLLSGFNPSFVDAKKFRLLSRFDVERLNLTYDALNQVWGYAPKLKKSGVWQLLKLIVTMWAPFKVEKAIHKYHMDATTDRSSNRWIRFLQAYFQIRWYWLKGFRSLHTRRFVPLLNQMDAVSRRIHQQEAVFEPANDSDLSYDQQKQRRSHHLQEAYKLGVDHFPAWLRQLVYYGRSFGLEASEHQGEMDKARITVCCSPALFERLVEPVLRQFGVKEWTYCKDEHEWTPVLAKQETDIVLVQEDWMARLQHQLDEEGYVYGRDYFQLPGIVNVT